MGNTIDSSNTVWVSLHCWPDPLAAIKKYALEHLSFDRLLQDHDLRKPAIDTVDSISGHKNKWHAPSPYRVGDGVNHFSIKVDVENRRMKVLAPGCGHCICHSTEWTYHIKAKLSQHVTHHHTGERFVLDQQKPDFP